MSVCVVSPSVYEFHYKRNWNKNVFWQFDLMSFYSVLRAYNNIWLFFSSFPFCFRLECFCTWINSKAKMVGWLEYSNGKRKREERKTTHQTSNGTPAKHTPQTNFNCAAANTPTFSSGLQLKTKKKKELRLKCKRKLKKDYENLKNENKTA